MNNKCDNIGSSATYFVDSNSIPSFDILNNLNAEGKKALLSTGDSRFNGMAVLSFLHERYGSASLPDNDNVFKLPLYDRFKQQVVFPLDKNKTVLNVSSVDAANKKVYFPFTDIGGTVVKYPLVNKNGEIIERPGSAHSVATAADVYRELDTAYEYAKDAHAYNFNAQLEELKKTNEISFFNGTLTKDNNTLNFFAAAVYKPTASTSALTDIHSPQLDYILRYYHDRMSLVKDSNPNIPSTSIDTTSGSTGSSFVSKLALDQDLTAINSIISTNYWDVATPMSAYKNNKIKTSSINAAVIEQQKTISDLMSRIEAIEAVI